MFDKAHGVIYNKLTTLNLTLVPSPEPLSSRYP